MTTKDCPDCKPNEYQDDGDLCSKHFKELEEWGKKMEEEMEEKDKEIGTARAVNAAKPLECPHCGHATAPEAFDAHELMDAGNQYQVVCDTHQKGCGASSGWADTPEEAVEKWNRRAKPLEAPSIPRHSDDPWGCPGCVYEREQRAKLYTHPHPLALPRVEPSPQDTTERN